jgi:GNAT superfamily N-acetyltransferase
MLRERRFLVAELDGEVAGFGIVDPPAELLNALYVAPESTGRGVGSALLLALEEIAIASGRTSLWLEATLNAASFYEARGWQRVASSAAEFPSGVTLPSVNMARMLRSATRSNRIGSTA